MSGIENKIKSFVSGEPGSTGYEVFEDSTATGPAPQFQAGEGQHHGTAGDAIGVGSTARAGGQAEGYSSGELGGLGGLGSAGQQGGIGHHSHEHGSNVSGVGSGLGGAAATAGALDGESHHGHHHHQHNSGIEPSSTSRIGDSYGSNPIGNSGRDHDRTGNLDQNAALYERTGTDGPATSGAAGTDRFDTDKGVDRTGATGNSFGARDDYPVHDTTERAEGKGLGGVGGILGTSDKDFTGRDRTGGVSGAYADSEGRFQGNTTGPGGNTALTGREGNVHNNPVAQAKDTLTSSHNDGTTGTTGTTGTHGTGAHGAHEEGAHKESLLEKAKHAVGL